MTEEMKKKMDELAFEFGNNSLNFYAGNYAFKVGFDAAYKLMSHPESEGRASFYERVFLEEKQKAIEFNKKIESLEAENAMLLITCEGWKLRAEETFALKSRIEKLEKIKNTLTFEVNAAMLYLESTGIANENYEAEPEHQMLKRFKEVLKEVAALKADEGEENEN